MLSPVVKREFKGFRGYVELNGREVWKAPERRKKRDEAAKDAMDYIKESS